MLPRTILPLALLTLSLTLVAPARGDDHDDAREIVTHLVNNLPGRFVREAVAAFENGQLDQAIANLTSAIKISPQFTEAYYLRGCMWIQKRNSQNAIQDFTEAIRINPQYARAYEMRGLARNPEKTPDLVVQDLSAAIRLGRNDSTVYCLRGYARTVQGNYRDAAADFTEAIRLDPRDADAYRERGVTWRRLGDYGLAVRDLTEAIRLDPRDAVAYRERGIIWVGKKDYARALADFNETIRLAPKQAKGHNERAWILATCPHSQLRDGRVALADATKACELTGYKSGMYIDTLAAAHAELGDFTKAVEFQKLAISRAQPSEQKELAEHLRLYEARKPCRL